MSVYFFVWMRVHKCLSIHVGTRDFSVVFIHLFDTKSLVHHFISRNSWLKEYPDILLPLPHPSSKAMAEVIKDARFCDDDVLLNSYPSVVAASILPTESSLGHQGTCLLCYERFGLAVARAGLTFYSFNSSALVTKTAFDSILKKFFTSYHWYLYHFKTSVFFFKT